jgi:hypothetical protein
MQPGAGRERLQASSNSTSYFDLDDSFTGLACERGLFSIVGFGSLLSQRSARSTFPELQNFRVAKVAVCEG